MEECERLERIAERDRAASEERLTQEKAAKPRNDTCPSISIIQYITHNHNHNNIVLYFDNPIFLGPWDPNLVPTQARALMQAQCAKLANAQQEIGMTPPRALSQKIASPMLDATDLSPSPWIFGSVLLLLGIGSLAVIIAVLAMMLRCCRRLVNLYRGHPGPVQNQQHVHDQAPVKSDQATQTLQHNGTASPVESTLAASSMTFPAGYMLVSSALVEERLEQFFRAQGLTWVPQLNPDGTESVR